MLIPPDDPEHLIPPSFWPDSRRFDLMLRLGADLDDPELADVKRRLDATIDGMTPEQDAAMRRHLVAALRFDPTAN